MTQPRWIDGEPPDDVGLAWLRDAYVTVDVLGQQVKAVRAVLGVRVDLGHGGVHEDGHWCEAGDYRGRTRQGPINGVITHWMPYEIPLAALDWAGDAELISSEGMASLARYLQRACQASLDHSAWLLKVAEALRHRVPAMPPAAALAEVLDIEV